MVVEGIGRFLGDPKHECPPDHGGPGGHLIVRAEAEGLEPPKACARRISSAVPYQLDYASGKPSSSSVENPAPCPC
jgi:hypothetical protein